MATVISKFLSFLLDPAYHWLFLGSLAFVLALLRQRGVRRLLFMLCAYMLVVLVTPVPYWMARSLEHSYPVLVAPSEKPAVVVLTGGTVEFNTEIDQYSWYARADRFLGAFRRWHEGGALFIITGRERDVDKMSPYISEAESMGRFAKEFGLPEERLILETKARSTRENALNVASILRDKGIEDFYLVTSAFHMKRSIYSFHSVGLNPTPYPVDFLSNLKRGQTFPFGGSNVSLFRIALHEYIGMGYYWLLNLFS